MFRLLSYAGRLQLIKSVLCAISNYWLECFSFPKTVLKKVDAICRTFLWTSDGTISQKSPIAWENECKPKSKGGLGIVNIETWNKIFLLKLLWNIFAKTDSLWVCWIHAYYLRHDNVMDRVSKSSDSETFKVVVQQRDMVNNIQSLWIAMVQ